MLKSRHIYQSGTSEAFVREMLEQYQKDCEKLAKLFPCTYCVRVKYLLTDNGLKKACEENCEMHKTWRDLGNGLMTRLERMKGDAK